MSHFGYLHFRSVVLFRNVPRIAIDPRHILSLTIGKRIIQPSECPRLARLFPGDIEQQCDPEIGARQERYGQSEHECFGFGFFEIKYRHRKK
jgi:hypothetical protein